jgi:hypothetical protein
MSAFVYGRLTSKREDAAAGRSSTTDPPGLKTYVDAFAALVPAEVLVAAAIFTAAFTNTTTTTSGDGQATLIITDRSSLKIAFYGLTLLALLLYVAGHVGKNAKHWDGWDFARMLVPPLAFIGWTMAVRPSPLSDAAFALSDGHKLLIIVFGGVLLGIAAARLGVTADTRDPPPCRG